MVTSKNTPPALPRNRSLYFLPLFSIGLLFIANRYIAIGTSGDVSMIPIMILAVGIVLSTKEKTGQATPGDGVLLFIGASILLLPGYNLIWALLASLSVYLMLREGSMGRAYMLILMPALYQLSTVYLLNWFASPILSLDALLTAQLLQLTHGVGYAFDNLIKGPGGHQVLVLQGCSSWNNLGLAWLLLFAVRQIRNLAHSAASYRIFLYLALALIALNTFRLHSMSIDIKWHRWWHEPAGESIYELMTLSFIGIAVLLTLRHEKAAH